MTTTKKLPTIERKPRRIICAFSGTEGPKFTKQTVFRSFSQGEARAPKFTVETIDPRINCASKPKKPALPDNTTDPRITKGRKTGEN